MTQLSSKIGIEEAWSKTEAKVGDPIGRPTASAASSGYLAKRAFDVVGALALLLILAPVLLVVAILVRLSGPNVLFAHPRVGQGGRLFPCYKFRTMVPDAQLVLERLLAERPDLKIEWERDFKLKDDPRVTRVGKFLRKYSLDELPQFWNVLRGDMSLVGPRPIIMEELKRYGQHADCYLTTRPGVTGLWQISGRSDVDYDRRIQLDREYMDRRCVTMDLAIVFKTAWVVLTRKGAY
ncbi:MAG TPA: sugar transferase [Candidatus Acidoferrales bacterium]|nr:sugar transferase [Candidatus Acidoferrales bacterium]